jgi:hypothetical protein
MDEDSPSGKVHNETPTTQFLECDCEASTMRGPGPLGALALRGKKKSTPRNAFMSCCLIKHRDTNTLPRLMVFAKRCWGNYLDLGRRGSKRKLGKIAWWGATFIRYPTQNMIRIVESRGIRLVECAAGTKLTNWNTKCNLSQNF